MQIVIDISKEEYQTYINHTEAILDKSIPLAHQDLLKAVINGKPLPEHYGRLGDLDDLEAEMINGIRAGNYEEGYEEYAHINDMDDCIECVKYAPTIIEGSDSE